MKKYLLPLLVGGVLSIFALVWTSPQINAASIYDLNYQTIDELRISRYDNAVNIDATFTYQQMLDGIYEDHNLQYIQNGYTMTPTQLQTMRDNWSNRQRWSISQGMSLNDSTKQIQLIFTTDDSLALTWKPDNVTANGTNGKTFRIDIVWNEASNRIIIYYYTVTPSSGSGSAYLNGVISGYTSSYHNIKAINYLTYVDPSKINYPAGYEGNLIRDSINPPVYFKPSISWSVDTTGVLRASYSNNSDIKLNGFGNYFLTDSDEDWSDGNVLDQKVERPFWQYQYEYDKLPSAGYYKLRVSYEEGTSWEVAPPGYDAVETQFFRIYWDGKSFIQGNNESCGGESEDYCDNTQGGNPFIEMLTEVNGNIYGLQAVITAPLVFITSIISYQSTCTPLVLELPYMNNKSLDLPCMTPIYEQYFGALFEFYQTVLTAIVSYYVFIRILHTVKDTQDPNINRIELAKL